MFCSFKDIQITFQRIGRVTMLARMLAENVNLYLVSSLCYQGVRAERLEALMGLTM